MKHNLIQPHHIILWCYMPDQIKRFCIISLKKLWHNWVEVVGYMDLDSLQSNSDCRMISAVRSALYLFIYFCIINRYRWITIKLSGFDRLQCSHLSLTALNPGPWLYPHCVTWITWTRLKKKGTSKKKKGPQRKPNQI
jgi:hypothetical protein